MKSSTPFCESKTKQRNCLSVMQSSEHLKDPEEQHHPHHQAEQNRLLYGATLLREEDSVETEFIFIPSPIIYRDLYITS